MRLVEHMKAGRAVIEVEHVSTRFGEREVHKDVSLAVYPGEVFAIAGSNGAGKSVLLREILFLMEPSAGSIRVFGKNVASMAEADILDARRRCGVLFQQGALFSSLTVAENVAAVLREHTKLSDALIRELADIKMGLAGFPLDSAAKLPNELSGGMRKRAALARAIALDPELLFLDEPTSGLDPVSAGGFDELVTRLKDSLKLTILMVTHDLDSLWRVADRVAVLGTGMVLGTGTMAQLSLSEEPTIRNYFHGPRGRSALAQAER